MLSAASTEVAATHTRLVFVLAAFGLSLPSVLTAQRRLPLRPGMRVRVVLRPANAQPVAPVSGTLCRLRGDTVAVVTVGSRYDTTIIALTEGRRLEVGLPIGARQGGTGAIIGAGVGALAGAGIAAATWRPCTGLCIYHPSRGVQTLIGAGIGAAGGALLGYIVGNRARANEWVPVSTAGVHVGLAPGSAGLGAAVSF